ncbi:hypothetical protein FJZ31_38260 [Candidatus Poribacteria bacterium]|nr:hypothetical protein [Candidatus Poribacteria bacterium]
MGDIIFEKLARSEELSKSPIFVFAADAMASTSLQGLGKVQSPTPHYRTRPEFLQLQREFIEDGYIDGLLMTPADAEVLALDEKLFDNSPITPIVRMNAETGIWNPRFGVYKQQPSRPFQTVPLDDAKYCEDLTNCAIECKIKLGLYSITLNNDVEADERMLNAYLRFAKEVSKIRGFDHILEVFLPNVNLPGMDLEKRGQYTADSIMRTMNYLRRRERPLFIKTAYTTKEIWKELTQFDPTLIIGALGGARQNARATLTLAYDVTEYGGKVILFGRAVFQEDNPRLIAKALRAVLDRKMTPEEAYKEYQQGLK